MPRKETARGNLPKRHNEPLETLTPFSGELDEWGSYIPSQAEIAARTEEIKHMRYGVPRANKAGDQTVMTPPRAGQMAPANGKAIVRAARLANPCISNKRAAQEEKL